MTQPLDSFSIADETLFGPKFPVSVSVTTTSRCNLRCVMCHHGIRKVRKQDFDVDLTQRFGQYFKEASDITLTGLGECFLSDSFWAILKLGRQEKAPSAKHVFSFNSNGTLLTDKNIDAVLESRVKRIRISIDSTDQAMKRRIRGFDLDKIVEGTRRLIEERNRRGYQFPLIGIEMTVMRDTFHEVGTMIDLALDLGVDFLEIWPLNSMDNRVAEAWEVAKKDWTFNYLQQMDYPLKEGELEAWEKNHLDAAERSGLAMYSLVSGISCGNAGYVAFAKQNKPPRPKISWKPQSIRCQLPWSQQRATYDGDVFNCCWGRRPLGNLRENTADEIWHGTEQQATREMLIEGIIPRSCETAPCSFVRGKTEPRTNDIMQTQYFNFSPFGNGNAAQGGGWAKGDNWGIRTGAKEATLQFTATQPVPDDAKLVITFRSDGEASHNLMVKVNGAPRVILVAKGNGSEQSITVPLFNDDAEAGATIALEQKRAGGNILFLHSVHVLGVSEADRLAQIERERLEQVERDRLAQAEIDRIESAA